MLRRGHTGECQVRERGPGALDAAASENASHMGARASWLCDAVPARLFYFSTPFATPNRHVAEKVDGTVRSQRWNAPSHNRLRDPAQPVCM